MRSVIKENRRGLGEKRIFRDPQGALWTRAAGLSTP